MMKSPLYHLRNPHLLFEHFHNNVHHAFVVFALAIIGMLRGASSILIQTSASWQRGGFLNQDFWTQNPSNANIMYALFGNGLPGSTAYTRTWSTSCVPTNVIYLTSLVGGTLPGNTIYIVSGGTYTLTSPLTINGNCTAFVGRGDVTIKSNGNGLFSNGSNKVIIDNIKFNGQNLTTIGVFISNSSNIIINNFDVYHYTNYGIFLTVNSNISLNHSRIYNNLRGLRASNNTTINNSQIYNNSLGIDVGQFENISINNSQIHNNNQGIHFGYLVNICPIIVCLLCATVNRNNSINNSLIYNNNQGIYIDLCLDNSDGTNSFAYTYILNNTKIYNNSIGIYSLNSLPNIPYFGNLQFFANTSNTGLLDNLSPGVGAPIASWIDGVLDDASIPMDYDRVTNPQNGIGQWLLIGANRTSLRLQQIFNPIMRPIRYIFGGNILKQITPVWFNTSNLEEYGSNGSDYTTTRYISEPDSTLPPPQQSLVNQYFGSGSTFTQNWQTNGCSLSAFQVVYLNPGIFTTANNQFQDHTIYILTGGEYRAAVPIGNGFIFNGNCIAVVGNQDTRFTKSGMGINNLFYANNKRNIIIDSIKVDGLYYDFNLYSTPTNAGINFDGTTNNNTLNNIQIYNNTQYGIFLGLGSHHTTIINAQLFNNGIAGMYLYYSSNYNVINNTQAYNNGLYGIWFANGSSRNTMNNFQAYNNDVGVFGDLTTQENIINRAAIYNNTDAGIYFKNAKGNALNDVMLYNNTVGIRALYSSAGNKYYGDLKLFDNGTDFDGTTANDGTLSPGSAGLFAYAGTLSTGSNMMGCTHVTNPNLSGTSVSLLSGTCNTTGYNPTFISSNNTYINYMFGLSMYKQKIPVRYTSTNVLVQIPSQYNASKYIAEIFPIWDDAPENVNFAGSGATQLNTRYTTSVYTAAVINTLVNVNLSFTPASASGHLIINGTTLGLTGQVNNGDTLQIRVLTPAGYNQTVTGTISIGSVTSLFAVTTRGFNQLPSTGSFAFANFTSVLPNTFIGSTTTVSGIETGVLASITFDPITTSGRLEIYSGTTFVAGGTAGLLVYNGNQVKTIVKSTSGFAQTITGYVTIGLGTGMFTITNKGADSTAPTTPLLIYPLSGEQLFFVSFEWTASTDTGSGIEGYAYEIANDTNFISIVHTGFQATGTMGSPNINFTTTYNTYYLRIKAKDRDGNSSPRSTTGSFKVIGLSGRNTTTIQNANLRAYYNSPHITLTGIKPGLSLWATVDGNGILYKNGNNSGTGAFVQNNDTISITIRSSNTHNQTLASVLTIANRQLQFNVTTKLRLIGGCTISDANKTTIQNIFDSLVHNYSGDPSKYAAFLLTMKSMLADQIDLTNNCNLQYIQDLIGIQISPNETGAINTGNHIAPNCKEYTVSYDTAKAGYTSPLFKVITYFANRDSLSRYIDSKNPGDCRINTYGAASWFFTNNDPNKHIAPNGKIYTLQNYGQGFTASEFSVARYFSTVSELRSFIDSKNPPQEIRSHQVDTSFTPQSYVAPNTKTYTIYKTNRGYMSYKLLKVNYFSTLADIQTFISVNNKK